MRDRSASAGFALSASGTNAVDMKTIGKKRSVIVLVACSLLVSNAGMKPAPTNAIPNAPDSRRIKRNPPIPVSILARNTSPTMSMMPDVACSTVARIRMAVVLPAPFGPRKPNNSPLATLNVLPSGAPARSALVRPLRGRGPRLRAIGRATMSPAKILSAGIGRNSNQRGQWVAARVTD